MIGAACAILARMKSSDLVLQRLNNQKLASSSFRQPVDVVRWLGAVQAQDYKAAKWAVALRMRNATHAAIEESFNEGRILRTHLLRPTWHFVTPEDIRWLLGLTAPRINLRCGPNYRKYELDGPTFKRSNNILSRALQGGKHLTRSELKRALNQSGVDTGDTVRLAHILLRAELDGVVCSGPRIGNQFTYALLEERVPPAAKRLSRQESLVTLTQRYFASHGPATLQDFIWWSGLSASDARAGIAQSELDSELLDETVYWRSRHAPPAASSRLSAHLLPVFDEYNVAYKARLAVLDEIAKLRPWDMLGPTVLLDGRVVGTWKSTLDKDSLRIAIKPAKDLKQIEQSAITKAADRYAAFVGAPAYVSRIADFI
jgi:winged helix DNA-binding protein